MQKKIIILLGLFFASCAPNNDQPKIRIVDLQGKPKPVVTKIPELNVNALASQNLAQDHRNSFQSNSSQSHSQTNYTQTNQAFVTQQSQQQNFANANNDFGSVSSQAIQQTLQSEQKEKKSEDNNAIVNGGMPEDEEQAVEYDLSEKTNSDKKSEKLEESATKKSVKNSHKKLSKKAISEVSGAKKFFVQVGSFTNRGNAESALGKMKKFHSGKIETLEGEKRVYRVLLGPFSSKVKANILVAKIKKSGNEAILVRGKE